MKNLFEQLSSEAREKFDQWDCEKLKSRVRKELEAEYYYIDLHYETISAMDSIGMIEDGKIYNIWRCFNGKLYVVEA